MPSMGWNTKPKKRKKKKLTNFSNIKIDLNATDDDNIVVYEENENEDRYIKLKDLYEGKKESEKIWISKFTGNQYQKIKYYQQILFSYQTSIIDLEDTSIENAIEVFTRINTEGQIPSLFEIMVAKTFDVQQFNLVEKWKKIEENLAGKGYNTIKGETMLQAVSGVIESNCSKNTILNIKKEKFIKEWDTVEKAFYQAIDYFRNCYKISSSQLLPYHSLLIPFTYFFYKNKNESINHDQQESLRGIFWKSIFAEQYFEGGKTINRYFNRMNKNYQGYKDDFDYGHLSIEPEDVKHKGKQFKPGDAYVKAVLCVLASKRTYFFWKQRRKSNH